MATTYEVVRVSPRQRNGDYKCTIRVSIDGDPVTMHYRSKLTPTEIIARLKTDKAVNVTQHLADKERSRLQMRYAGGEDISRVTPTYLTFEERDDIKTYVDGRAAAGKPVGRGT